jgi:NitT/TauT family transport system ATP-binding protein
VLAANPGRVRVVVDDALPRPRDYRSPEILALVDRLRDIITGSYLPDEQAGAPAGPLTYEPLPDATVSSIIGLLEFLDAHGGRDDVFRIAQETKQEFGRVITVVKAAEMLDLVDTPKRMVQLTPTGVRFVKAGLPERKELWRRELLQIRLFKDVAEMLERAPNHTLDRDVVLETIALLLPSEDYEKTFDHLIAWGRFGDVLSYDEDLQSLSQPKSSELELSLP